MGKGRAMLQESLQGPGGVWGREDFALCCSTVELELDWQAVGRAVCLRPFLDNNSRAHRESC